VNWKIIAWRWRVVSLVLFCVNICIATENCSAATPQKTLGYSELKEFSGEKSLLNGIEVHSGKAILQVIALRDDVLRVRIGRDGVLPEDASWAVLASSRAQRATVTPDNTSAAVGFRTKNLRVQIERATLRMVISDLQGNILQEGCRRLACRVS
jgi:alpha-glucosidase